MMPLYLLKFVLTVGACAVAAIYITVPMRWPTGWAAALGIMVGCVGYMAYVALGPC